jgi:glycosyltransferase involved in cell wall biosynthesis
LAGIGGMVSFQHRLAAGLAKRGIEVTYDLADRPYQAVLVIGGTRRLPALWKVRRDGIPVVQRLDGMNWVHRLRRTGWRHHLRAEYGNLLLATIRSRLAHRIVYQSGFSLDWWERVHGPTPVPNCVIYNGVDLDRYSANGAGRRPEDRERLLLVEGSLMGGYEIGLEWAVGLAERLATREGSAHRHTPRRVELLVVGRVSPEIRSSWEKRILERIPDQAVRIEWLGAVPGERIPEIDRSAHLLYSADLNPACPNSVIEALACGLPIVAFDTGALLEMVTGDAGRVVSYGGDPWRLDPPDLPGLASAAAEILEDPQRFRVAARERAEAAFSQERMVEEYLQILLE